MTAPTHLLIPLDAVLVPSLKPTALMKKVGAVSLPGRSARPLHKRLVKVAKHTLKVLFGNRRSVTGSADDAHLWRLRNHGLPLTKPKPPDQRSTGSPFLV